MSTCCLPNCEADPIIEKVMARFNVYSILPVRIFAWGVLIGMCLWLIVRFQEPDVYLTSIKVDGINATDSATSTLIHYDIAVHNPDIFKTVRYNVLVLRFKFSGYSSASGVTVKFDVGPDGMTQRPMQTFHLSNHSIDYTVPEADWYFKDMSGLRTDNEFIYLRFVMEVSFMFFDRVVGKRQFMRTAEVYLNDRGSPFIRTSRGLRFK